MSVDLETAKAMIRAGAKFGDVFPFLGSVADGEELKRFFCFDLPAVFPQNGKPPPRKSDKQVARERGFEGDPCPVCGQMMLVRNGNCLLCKSCGSTTGCS